MKNGYMRSAALCVTMHLQSLSLRMPKGPLIARDEPYCPYCGYAAEPKRDDPFEERSGRELGSTPDPIRPAGI